MARPRLPIDGEITFTLPRRVHAALVLYCLEEDEQPADVIADAVTLHLDALAGETPEIAAPAAIGDGKEPAAATPAREPTRADGERSLSPVMQPGRPVPVASQALAATTGERP